jgi:hypothetical protein
MVIRDGKKRNAECNRKLQFNIMYLECYLFLVGYVVTYSLPLLYTMLCQIVDRNPLGDRMGKGVEVAEYAKRQH